VSTSSLDLALYVPGAGCAFATAAPGGQVQTHHVLDAALGACGASNAGSVLSDGESLPVLGAPATPSWIARGPSDSLAVRVPGPEAYDVYVDGIYVGTTDANGNFTGAAGSYVDHSRITLVATTPTASTGPVTSSGATTLTWSPVSDLTGVTGIRVYRDGVLLATLAPGATSFVDPDPATGVRYSVRPVTASGERAPLPVQTAPTPAPAAVFPNTSGEACANFGTLEYRDGAFRVAWQPVAQSASAPLSGYRLYRLPTGASAAQWASAAPVYTGTAAAFTDPQASGSYGYRVSAYGVGGESAKSPVQCASVVPAPAAPALTAKAGDSSVTLTWNAVTSASTYEVFRLEGTSQVLVASTSSTSYNVTPLANGVLHSFVVKARNVGNSSSASNTASATPLAPVPAVPVLSASLDRATGKVSLTWPAVARADTYSLYANGTLVQAGITGVSYQDTLSAAQGSGSYTLSATSTGGTSAQSTAVRVSYAYSDLVVSDAPVGYYRLNEATGTTAVNSAPSGVSGRLGDASYAGALTRSQASPVAADSSSRALGFNGGHVVLPSITLSGTKGYTFETWYASTNASNWQRILDLSVNGTTSNEIFVPTRTSDNGVCSCGSGSRYVGTTAPASNGAWHHLVITIAADGRSVLYLDGVAASVANYAPYSTSSTYAVNYLGKSISPDPMFAGSMSEFAVYDKALTATQVTKHYNAR
jgi:hypothetical protein